jgi:peptidoglycan L-alanyl-D-glutamate endopeptidase CwlK
MTRDIKDCAGSIPVSYRNACDAFKHAYPGLPQPFVCCAIRTSAEQNELYNRTRDGKDNNGNGKIDEPGEKVTNAKGGESPHNFKPSFAFDIAFINTYNKLDYSEHLFEKFAAIIKAIDANVEWGGDFQSMVDRPHFQLKGWKEQVTGKKLKSI